MEKKTVKKSAQKPTKASSDNRPKCYDRTPFECKWCGLKFDSIRKVDVHERTSHWKISCATLPAPFATAVKRSYNGL
jgi:formamidopyrimidine-DNA glycosylase